MAKNVLLGPDGNPIDRSLLTREIAGPTLTGVRSTMRGYPSDGLDPVRLATILRAADHGWPLPYFELAELVEERDLHYAGVLATRKRSVAQLEILVDAASDAPEHVAHADMVREWLDRDILQGALFDALDAIGKGVSLLEIVWDTSEHQWFPGRLEWRDPRGFGFDPRDGATPLLRTEAGDVPLAPWKFLRTEIRAKSGLPIRSGIARLALWAWMFKSMTLKDWAIFAQNFGQPIRLGKYEQSASSDDQEILYQAVANIAGDCAAVIPAGMSIEFIESKSIAASTDLYERRADWIDRQISKAVLGQTATTDAIAGGHAVGQEHRQVQEDIERADAKALAASISRDLIRPWIDLEFGPQGKYPRLRIGRREEKDAKLVVDSLEKLVPLGLRVEASEINDLLGLSLPAEGAVILAASAPSPVPGQPGPSDPATLDPVTAAPQAVRSLFAAAAKPPRDAVDLLVDATDALAGDAMDAMIGRVRELVAGATSLDQVRDGLLGLSPQMPVADLAAVMRQALVIAELSGRSEMAAPFTPAPPGASDG